MVLLLALILLRQTVTPADLLRWVLDGQVPLLDLPARWVHLRAVAWAGGAGFGALGLDACFLPLLHPPHILAAGEPASELPVCFSY